MEQTEVILAYGNQLIQSTHRTTFEITKEKTLTTRGDCIIAVDSNKAVSDLSRELKEAARNPEAEIVITIEVGKEKEIVRARGDPRLSFTHPTDLVVRKSSYTCNRTLAVKADKAAKDLSRRLVGELRNPRQKVQIALTVRTLDQKP